MKPKVLLNRPKGSVVSNYPLQSKVSVPGPGVTSVVCASIVVSTLDPLAGTEDLRMLRLPSSNSPPKGHWPQYGPNILSVAMQCSTVLIVIMVAEYADPFQMINADNNQTASGS